MTTQNPISSIDVAKRNVKSAKAVIDSLRSRIRAQEEILSSAEIKVKNLRDEERSAVNHFRAETRKLEIAERDERARVQASGHWDSLTKRIVVRPDEENIAQAYRLAYEASK